MRKAFDNYMRNNESLTYLRIYMLADFHANYFIEELRKWTVTYISQQPTLVFKIIINNDLNLYCSPLFFKENVEKICKFTDSSHGTHIRW